jgi:hypothetical protein
MGFLKSFSRAATILASVGVISGRIATRRPPLSRKSKSCPTSSPPLFFHTTPSAPGPDRHIRQNRIAGRLRATSKGCSFGPRNRQGKRSEILAGFASSSKKSHCGSGAE